MDFSHAIIPLLLLAWSSGSVAEKTAPNDAAHIRHLILQSVDDCLAGRPERSLAALDPDFAMTFPNSPFQNHAGMVLDYGNMCKASGETGLLRNKGEFEELTVEGDSAVARITWTSSNRQSPDAVRRIGELQVWRRTAQGWRWWRSARWPLKPVTP